MVYPSVAAFGPSPAPPRWPLPHPGITLVPSSGPIAPPPMLLSLTLVSHGILPLPPSGTLRFQQVDPVTPSQDIPWPHPWDDAKGYPPDTLPHHYPGAKAKKAYKLGDSGHASVRMTQRRDYVETYSPCWLMPPPYSFTSLMDHVLTRKPFCTAAFSLMMWHRYLRSPVGAMAASGCRDGGHHVD